MNNMIANVSKDAQANNKPIRLSSINYLLQYEELYADDTYEPSIERTQEVAFNLRQNLNIQTIN